MAAPVITTTEIPAGKEGIQYKFQMEATGDGLTWNSPNIHPYLYITPDGSIEGFPTYQQGDFTFTITASNSEGSDSRDFTVNVGPYNGEPIIYTEKLPPIFNGVYYPTTGIEYQLYGTPVWTFTGLPEGFTTDGSYFSGYNDTLEVGSFITIGVEAVNEFGRDYREYEVEILDGSVIPVINTFEIPAGKVGEPYKFQLDGTSDTPATWSIQWNAYVLPQGINLSKTGLLSGVPLIEEEVYVSFQLENKYSSVWRGFSMKVEAGSPNSSGGDGTEAWWAINVIQGDML